MEPGRFHELFALSTDRRAALTQLVPGSVEFYYYSCLQRQHEGDLAAVPPLLQAWIERHGRGERVTEIENRQALLGYARDPAGTRAFLIERLQLHFDHQRDPLGEVPDLPTRLDPARIAWSELARRALQARPGALDGFTDSALRALAAQELPDSLLPALLDRLDRPDVPRLPELVARALRLRNSRGFGSLRVHRNMLLPQLEELATALPELPGDATFVNTWIQRLEPAPDEVADDPRVELAHLERLHAFAQRLPPAFNAFKARVLYHRLLHDLRAGRPDLERFRAYLRFPRQSPWAHPRFLEDRKPGEALADLEEGPVEALATVADDEPLVRAYLEHFLRDADTPEAFGQLLRKEYLERVFAETKLLHGVGDQERWYAMLDSPALVEELEKRVELGFPFTQPRMWGADEPVSVELDVKNVPTLLVKVYEIDALSYYRAEQREVDATIALDGLLANEERTLTYAEAPMRRVRRRFEFPALARPGVFVIEFIGNGSSSRVVVRKGGLTALARMGASGHVLTVLDESGARRADAVVHLGTQRFAADERGEVRVPFSTEAGTKSIVLEAGARAALHELDHREERYTLRAGFLLDREQLRPGGKARLVVRPALSVNGEPASLRLLEEPALVIESTDLLGVKASSTVRGLALRDDAELVHELHVPPGLASLQVSLRARVQSLSRGEPVELSSPAAAGTFQLNQIDRTEATWSPLLGRTPEGYHLDLRGKNGEPKVDQPLRLELKHRDFHQQVEVVLKSDAGGRIHLGPLEGITRIQPQGLAHTSSWDLVDADAWPVLRVQARAGETVRVPYNGRASQASRALHSFLELRRGEYARDAFERVALAGGYIELRALPAGDYSLHLVETGHTLEVHVGAGEAREDLVVGAARVLERTPSHPLSITALALAADVLEARVAGAGPSARVHVLATRYAPAYEPLEQLAVGGPLAPAAIGLPRPESEALSGRELSDELRYVLDRRLARRFPGNMLPRPGLILNPWSLDETMRGLEPVGGSGRGFGGRVGGKRSGGGNPGPASTPAPVENAQVFANLDFLGVPGVLLANLRPGPDGVVRVPLADLGGGRVVHVLAADALSVARRSLALPEAPLTLSDRRLARALDPAKHFQEHRGIELVAAGAQVPLPEGSTASFRTYGTLGDVFGVFRALRPDVDLEPFAFLLRWPSLSPEEQRELYSRHACHELHFFLHEKDPAFFAQVVRPYLTNKAGKTFLDRWLLGEPLELYLEPWRFERLNTLERILLARRTGRLPQVTRQVGDELELRPMDPREEEQRFSTLLLGRALEEAGAVEYAAKPDAAPSGPATPGSPPERRRQSAGEQLKDALSAEEEAPAEKASKALGSDDFYLGRAESRLDQDADRNKSIALYRNVDRTKVYAEHDWWRTPVQAHDERLIGVRRFWHEYAQSPADAPFFSAHFAEATQNAAEMLCALAVLDLPFEAEAPVVGRGAAGLTLEASAPLLLVRREVREARAPAGKTSLLVSQDFFRLDDRYRFEGARRLDKLVREGFVAGVAYGCRVVVTNPTSAPEEVELLLQVPAGAIPVQGNVRTRGMRLQLEPYATAAHEYAFYFPSAGSFAHHPVQVTRAGELLAAAQPVALEVLARPAAIDDASWEHVSQRGTLEQVLAHMEQSNLARLALGRVAWRMRERAAFERILQVLRERLVFDEDLWSYGLLHGDEGAMREYLHRRGELMAASGRWLRSPLLDIDPVELRTWQHLEFDPLVNGRAHRFGPRRTITDPVVEQQFDALLAILSYQPSPGDREWMLVSYHLLLQDRIEEALAAFARVDPAALESRLQHAYMSAYVAFYTEDLAAARRIAEAHRGHPVTRWRALFQGVLDQLDEARGAGARVSNGGDLAQRQGQAAAGEPTLALALEGRKLRLSARNLDACELRYHPMDIEFLFSTSPFVQQESAAAVYVRPHRVDAVELPASGELVLDLPEEYRNSNVLVEARAGGLTRRRPSVTSSLDVHWMESYGQLAVLDAADKHPLSKVYVKVFARQGDGHVRFHKDGYTDLRGRFDYATLSGEGAQDVERFAVLVYSDDRGAVVAEIAPPAR